MYEGVEMQKNKKQFYITELHFGDDGLESYTDYSGPFTLSKARYIMEKLMKKVCSVLQKVFGKRFVIFQILLRRDWVKNLEEYLLRFQKKHCKNMVSHLILFPIELEHPLWMFLEVLLRPMMVRF